MQSLATKPLETEKKEKSIPGEKLLIIHCLEAHIDDLKSKKVWRRRNAVKFITSHHFDYFCDLINWDADIIRQQFRKDGYLE